MAPTLAQAPVSLDELRSSQKLRDFDDEDVYNSVLEQAAAAKTRNFVVRFGARKAEIALDLDRSELSLLLNVRARGEYPICWINIWDPSLQPGLVHAIGKKYGFSDRLQKSITIWDDFKRAYNDRKKGQQDAKVEGRKSLQASRPKQDLEHGVVAADASGQSGKAAPEPLDDENLLLTQESIATFKLLQGSLNYTTIDQGDDFICIGANWLHKRPEARDGRPLHDLPLVPPKHWSWFSFCKDNTVISFHESPAYEDERIIPEGESKTEWRAKELEQMRSNTHKVLRHISSARSRKDRENFIQLTDVRRLLCSRDTATHPVGEVEENERHLDCAANLFYYLFEDYAAAVVILDASQRTLKRLRDGVFARHGHWKNQSYRKDHTIQKLHRLSMDLRQLRHLFESYKTLIARLLDTKPTPSEESGRMTPAADRLSKRARNRFQRLSDRLQLLMLNTIQEYLDEKSALSDTYFNLTAQKDSEATARLTRSATLLAKLSVFFLPISFMTGYFSVQIPEITEGYTAKTYWGVFGVVAALSFLSLFFFSRVLMFVSEALDDYVNRTTNLAMNAFGRRGPEAADDDDDY